MNPSGLIYASLIKVISPESGITDLHAYILDEITNNNPSLSAITSDRQLKQLKGVAVEPNVSFYINLMLKGAVPVGDDYIYRYVPFSEDFFTLVEHVTDGVSTFSFDTALPIIHFVGFAVKNNGKVARRKNFIDSSIWHYAVTNKETLKSAITKIKNNKEYYKLLIAQESAELSKRLYLNSELISPTAAPVNGITKSAGHSQSVVPFKFHSESEMARKAQLLVDELKNRYFSHREDIKWRLLFVDDHAKTSMSIAIGNDNPELSKEMMLRRRLGEVAVLFNKEISDLFDFSPQTSIATSITSDNNSSSSAISKIKERRYDIIILDYLLEEEDSPNVDEELNKRICLWDYYIADKEEQPANSRIDYTIKERTLGGKVRWYGYMLLSYISNLIGTCAVFKDQHSEEERLKYNQLAKELKAAKGICGKFWFMFSSGFASAVQDRLLTEGYSHSNRNWYIGRTACPTTTPELFKYNLLTMMKNQLDHITRIGLDEDEDKIAERRELKQNKEQGKERILNLTDLLRKIFCRSVSTRESAILYFNNLLMMRARYKLLKTDCEYNKTARTGHNENGSTLVQSLYPEMNRYSNAFWEHVQHLVYLVAFGNIRQWNEMWDEYLFIKDILDSVETETFNVQEDLVSDHIAQYIYGVKRANN